MNPSRSSSHGSEGSSWLEDPTFSLEYLTPGQRYTAVITLLIMVLMVLFGMPRAGSEAIDRIQLLPQGADVTDLGLPGSSQGAAATPGASLTPPPVSLTAPPSTTTTTAAATTTTLPTSTTTTSSAPTTTTTTTTSPAPCPVPGFSPELCDQL